MLKLDVTINPTRVWHTLWDRHTPILKLKELVKPTFSNKERRLGAQYRLQPFLSSTHKKKMALKSLFTLQLNVSQVQSGPRRQYDRGFCFCFGS